MDFIADYMKKHCIQEISKAGIRLGTKELDFEKEIRELIPDLKNAKLHTVIFLDEFAEVINKLRKTGAEKDAVDILHTLREIRSDDDFKHFTIVYAGSIGLEFVIRNIDRPTLINDLHRIKLPALTSEEASKLIRQLTRDASILFSDEALEYLKKKVEYLLPYYIQLMIEAIDEVAFEIDVPKITPETIDIAYLRVLKERKNFEDWLLRLKDYQPQQFPFINELLKYAAHNESLPVQLVYRKAQDYGRTEDYMDFIEELEYDGYLTEAEEGLFRFTSPFLRQFWKQKYPIYEG